MSTTIKPNLAPDIRPRGLGALRRLGTRRRSAPGSAGGSSATPIRRKPSVDFSLTGLIYCSMMMFIGLAAINSQANLLFGVFGLMIGILLIGATICRLVLSRLSVERVIPDYAAVGQSATIQYQFLNSKRFWPSFSVTVAELEGAEAFNMQPHAYLLHAAPGRIAAIPVEVVPKRRGLHKLRNYQLSTSFPFGFVKRALIRHLEESILIYPAIGSVNPRLLSLCKSAERGGANMKPRRNGADEFYGVKEFRNGENPRWIHWKRSARTGALVSKEMVQISPPRLLILVDTCLTSTAMEDHVAVEKSIAMAASLASRALDSGMAVGLCVWTGQWTVIAPQRGKRHCRDILGALAGVPRNRDVSIKELIEQSEGLVGDRVTPILFTPRRMSVGPAERLRGGLVIVPADSAQAQSWFQFDPAVDFSRCMPADQARDIAAVVEAGPAH